MRLTNTMLKALIINEAIEHSQISKVVATASKLLTAIENFEKNTSELSIEFGQEIDIVRKNLINMINAPASYLPKKQVKVIKKIEPKV